MDDVRTPAGAPSAPGNGPAPSPWTHRRVAVLVAGALFMELLDATIVATAAPAMSRSLHVPAASISLAITAYLLTVAALIPTSGWVADRWGARPTFLLAIAVFTVASGLCATSTSLGALTGFRVLQGAGGALMVPVGRLAVFRGTEKSDLVRAVAFLTWPALVAPVAAPGLSGVLTTYLSWHWVFLVNLPLGAVALVAAARIMPRDEPRSAAPLDWPGMLLVASTLSAVVVATTALGDRRVSWPLVGASAGAGLLTALGAVRHLRRSPAPLFDLDVFRLRTFRAAQAGGSAYRIAISAVPFLLPLMFEESFGWTAARTGAVVLTLFVGNLVIKPATTPVLRAVGFRVMLAGSALALAATVAGIALLRPTTPMVVMVPLLVLSGAARSVGLTAYSTIALADVEPAQLTTASTLSSALQQVSLGTGVAVASIALRVGQALTPGGTGPYRLAFLAVAALALAVAVASLRLGSDAGAVVAAGRARRAQTT